MFSNVTDEPVSVTSPNYDTEQNVILWLDHRPVKETDVVNATEHNLLRYVGGRMSIEMEIPKVLWLKNNMPKEHFDQCKFYDLPDALTHIATGSDKRSFCSAVCKQGYVPVGVDGSVRGWQEDFLSEIGLEELTEDNFKRMGGVDGVVSLFLLSVFKLARILATNPLYLCISRTVITLALVNLLETFAKRRLVNLDYLRELPLAVLLLTPMLAGLGPSALRLTWSQTS